MLYKPTFCCHCGNEIERIKWTLLTSRRFCENCEPEFRKEEWLPRAIPAILVLLSGLFAFGSYLKTPEKPLSLTPNRTLNSSIENTQNKNVQGNTNVNSVKTLQQTSIATNNQNVAQSNVSSVPSTEQAQILQNMPEEPVYFCGAQTKKGTPCSRKVKGGGRCWQHTGQPSMLPKDKLVVAR